MALTLSQAARKLGVAQHKLIHLCERKVVIPEVRDARGRGSSRLFSKRNLFDFAVALELRRLEMPVSFVRAVLAVLRSFEAEARKLLPGFVLPEGLQAAGAPRVLLSIVNGERLHFSMIGKGEPTRVLGGVDIRRGAARGRAGQHRGAGRLKPTHGEKLLADVRTRVDVDLSRIAADIGQ